MKQISRLFGCCLMLAGALDARAYIEATHEELTRAAVVQSVMQTDPTSLRNLGLDTDAAILFPGPDGTLRTIQELLQIGSRLEDSASLTLIRPLRHFYSPVTGLGLDIPALPTQTSSPVWALARPGGVPDQEFSYGNARQSLFDALTKTAEGERKAAFGRAFRTLGQVVHHIQDMAQPQHVRNDVHCDSFACVLIGAYAPSRYERWTDGIRGNLPMDISLTGYDITSPAFTSIFNSPRRFWNTEPPGANSPAAGKGIAEYTNSNFVSAGTNFRFNNGTVSTHPVYTRPAPGQAGNPVPVGELFNGVPSSVQFGCRFDPENCFMTFYSTTGTDPLTGELFTNDRASTLSIFDQDLKSTVQFTDPGTGENYSTQRIFALNSLNFRRAHDFLIPRAVSYSAAMINYFLRGKIDLVEDDDNLGNYVLKNLSNEPMSGTFALYYDYDDADAGTVNNRKLLVSWDKTIPANGQESVGTIPAPGIPEPKNTGELMLVFSGDMGEETRAEFGTGAVAAKPVTLTPVLLFAATHSESTLNGDTYMEFNFSFPEKYAQKIRSNPGALSFQVNGVTYPITSNGSVPDGCFLFISLVFPPGPCVDLEGTIGGTSGTSNWRFFMPFNNEFAAWIPELGVTLAGVSPQTLSPDQREYLCGSVVVNGNARLKAPFIDSTELDVFLDGPQALVQIRAIFDGKVLFGFDASRGADNGAFEGQFNTSLSFDTLLSNANNIRLTKVRCRVNMQ